MLPFGQLWYHFVMIEIPMGLLYEQLNKLLFSDAPKYDRTVGNGFIRSAENAKHFRISRREIRNDCLAAMRFCSKIAGMHKCIPYA